MDANRLTALALLAALASGACGAGVHTNSFATFAEARERGAVERGWVPSMLPAGAYELRAAYEPDGWRRWGILNFRAADADALRAILSPDEMSLAGTRMDIPPRIEWWPVALRGELDPEPLASTGLRAYRARAGDLVFAVNWNQGRAYYWADARFRN